MKPIIAGSLVALSALSLTANALMYLRYSSSRPLVTVGSQVISKKDYQDAVDFQTQGAILKKMVVADLINQAAAKAGVSPTASDVDAQVAALRRREPQALTEADGDPGRMAQLRQNLQTDLALENLRIHGVSVTDAQVAAYYTSHRSAFALPSQVQTTMVLTENPVDAAQAAALLRQDIGVDIIARQPRLHVVGVNGFNVNWQALPPAVGQKISATVLAMRSGDVETLPVGKYDLVVRAARRSAAGVPPLSQIRPQVMRLAALDRAVPAATEIARLYQASTPRFAVARYADYFADLTQPAATKTASAQ